MSADRLHTDSGAQTAEEIIGRQEFDGHGVMRDGTLLTIWKDGRGYDGGGSVRRAYRLQLPSGEVRTGRLPDGVPARYVSAGSVRTTRSGFVILGSPDVVLSPDGSIRPFRAALATGGPPVHDGDLLVPSVEGQVRLLRPRTRTEHVVRLDRSVRPLALGGGRVYGYLDPPPPLGLRFGPVHIGSWRGDGWTDHVVGTFFELDAVADGRRAAAWVCDEGGHGSGGAGSACASRGFAVTTDGGVTWRQLTRSERVFDQVDAAVASGGRLYIDAWPHGYWRSTDGSWSSFKRLDLPRDAVLHAEDGFVSASLDRKGGLTILRLGADGRATYRWTVRVPKGPAPWNPDYGFAELAGSGDGSVVVRAGYMRPRSRLVTSTGVAADGRWPLPIGLSEGFLVKDRKQLGASNLLTPEGETRPTAMGSPDELWPGDSLLTTGRRVPHVYPPTHRHERLWSFRPGDATFRQLTVPPVRPGGAVGAVVDPHGDAWVVQGRSLWHSDDSGASWRRNQLPHPAWPGGIEVAGRRVLLLLHSPSGDVARILGPQRRWRSVELPSNLPGPADTWLLSDGRLLIGPVGGRFWRGTSPTNTRFETIPAGPIAQVTTAGDLLYGVPLSPEFELRTPLPLKSDWNRVWVSQDGGSSWRQVTE